MPAGGNLTLSAEDVVVTNGGPDAPSTLSPGRYIRLRVGDDGEGMDPATLARAVEPFFTTKPLGKGTGLGLSMARGFAEQSGGALAVESRRGEGTVVTLWLPLTITAQAADLPLAEATLAAAGRDSAMARILLVDDEALVLQTLDEQLSDKGYAVTAAAGAAEALRLLDEAGPFDMLITDLSMPGGMDGLALIREARQRAPGLPAVLLTGYAGDGTETTLAVDGATSGAFTLLRKPVSDAQLSERVAALLAPRMGDAATASPSVS
jgi:CheY-like chemotaxis protein